VRLHDGSVVESECLSAQGGADRPFPADVLERKIASLVAPAYPRLPAALAAIMALDADLLERGWRTLVDDFCA